MKLFACLAAATACAAAVPATAAVTYSTFNISFTNGLAIATPSPARTVVGEYQDTYVFTVGTAGTFSGSLTTQRLRDPNGNVVSDLDFGNSIDGISLDGGTPFADPLVGSDALEVANLLSTPISAGTHHLVVNYTVQTASAGHAASYAGPLNFAAATSAVPEPASWAMFVGAFGMVGAGLRQRRAARVTFLA